MKRKIIQIPIFHRIIEVIWSEKLESINQYVSDVCGDWYPPIHETCDGRTWVTTDGYVYVGLTSEDKSIWVHELTHAVFAITKSLNIEDEETFCYLLEYIFKQVTDD